MNLLPHVSQTKPVGKRKLCGGWCWHCEQTEGFS